MGFLGGFPPQAPTLSDTWCSFLLAVTFSAPLKCVFQAMCACVCPAVVLTLCNPTYSSPPGLSVHGVSRQEYMSGLPFLLLGDLPDPGIEPMSPALAGRFFTTGPPGKPI